MLTLSIFHTFFYCFCRWLWTSKCYLGYFSLYCKIQQIFTCSKSTIVTLERGAEYVSHLLSSVSIVDFEQKNDLWVCVFIKNSAEVLPTSMEKLKPETMKPRVLYKTMIRIGSNKYSRIWVKQNFPVLWLKIFLRFQRSFCFFHTWWYSSFSNISAKNIFYTRCFGITCSK